MAPSVVAPMNCATPHDVQYEPQKIATTVATSLTSLVTSSAPVSAPQKIATAITPMKCAVPQPQTVHQTYPADFFPTLFSPPGNEKHKLRLQSSW